MYTFSLAATNFQRLVLHLLEVLLLFVGVFSEVSPVLIDH